MVRNYVRKTDQQKWSEQAMREAVTKVRDKELSLDDAAKAYEVPKTTLFRRVRKPGDANDVSKKGLGRFRTVFTEQQEKDLGDYLLFMENRLFGLTLVDFRRLAYQFAVRNGVKHPFNTEQEMAGEDFVCGFLKRNGKLSLRSPEAMSAARAAGFNKVVVMDFYGLLDKLYEQYNFPPSRIYNSDETGIMTVPNKTSKVISMKGKKQVGILTSAERGTLVTAEICCNAIGNYVPPLLIFPRKNRNSLFEIGAPPDVLITCHPSGWMQTDIFAPTWFEHFLHHVKPTADDPVLLIFDGHATHTKNIALIEMARANHVHILVLPPHTSHRLQPLDVSFMGPLNTYYEQEVRVWLRNHPGKVITIYQVAALFGTAYQKAATSSTAISGFAKTGICPFNPNLFPDHVFAAAETTERPAPDNGPLPSTSGEHNNTPLNPGDEEPHSMAAPDQMPPTIAAPCQETPTIAAPDEETPTTAAPDTAPSPIAQPGPAPAPLVAPTQAAALGMATPASKCSEMDGTHHVYVSPVDIMGVPQVDQTESRRHGIKWGKTVILTSSPHLKELQSDILGKKRKKPVVRAQLFPKKSVLLKMYKRGKGRGKGRESKVSLRTWRKET